MLIRRCAAVLAAVAFLAAPAGAADYRIGLLLPFSGVYAGLGSHIENGFRLGLEHFADELDGNAIELLREDTEAKPATGLAKARKLVLDDGVDALAGVVSSGVLAGLRDFVHQSRTPLVVANAGNDLMTGEKCSPYLVRVSFSNSMIVRPMGPWMAGRGVKTAYLLAPDYAAGHQMMTTFRESFEAAGGRVVGEAYPPLQGVKDYGPYLDAARAADPESIFVFFAGGAAITFVKQYQELGLKDAIPLYGAGWLTSPVYVHVQGDAADGIVGSLNYVTTIDTPENRRFQAAYRAAHDGKPGSEFAVAGYDAARAIVRAAAAAGDDKDAFAAHLRQVRFDGPRGPLRIDPATNNVIQNIYVFETRSRDGAADHAILDTIEDVRDAPHGCVLN